LVPCPRKRRASDALSIAEALALQSPPTIYRNDLPSRRDGNDGLAGSRVDRKVTVAFAILDRPDNGRFIVRPPALILMKARPWRFSLRELLIATTYIALVIGALIWLNRQSSMIGHRPAAAASNP
jgi:hypothetical protein